MARVVVTLTLAIWVAFVSSAMAIVTPSQPTVILEDNAITIDPRGYGVSAAHVKLLYTGDLQDIHAGPLLDPPLVFINRIADGEAQFVVARMSHTTAPTAPDVLLTLEWGTEEGEATITLIELVDEEFEFIPGYGSSE